MHPRITVRFACCLPLALALSIAAGCSGGVAIVDCSPPCPDGYDCRPEGCVLKPGAVLDLSVPPPGDLAGVCFPACGTEAPHCVGGLCQVCDTDEHCPFGAVCRKSGGVAFCLPGCAANGRCGPGKACCAGACTDTATDPEHCGSCGHSCAAPHAMGACMAGTCSLGRCAAPWADCNADASDGCEANLHQDVKNCAACGMACDPANAIAGCGAEGCFVSACRFGFENCDGNDTNGCEIDIAGDVKNCGACGKPCAMAARAQIACSTGQCLITSCLAGYADCNGNYIDGCETVLASDRLNCGACGLQCGQNQICVKGECTCAQCNIPNAVAACVNNVCVMKSCQNGFADCDKLPQNGCEVDLRGDVRNCGACGAMCGAQKPFCLGGVCDTVGVSCAAILQSNPRAPSGPYTIDPDGVGGNAPINTVCDMTNDGGGWTLVAKVHRYHTGYSKYDEPDTWFAQERDTASLVDSTSYDNRLPGQASFGKVLLGPLANRSTLTRFVVIAEADTNMRAQWFKELAPDVWLWFGQADHAATKVCQDVAMTKGCSMGKLRGSVGSATWFDGMNLADYGYPAGGPIHMRLNNDQSGATYDGLCSYTNNNNNNQWNDVAIDGHWGNGLEIWMR